MRLLEILKLFDESNTLITVETSCYNFVKNITIEDFYKDSFLFERSTEMVVTSAYPIGENKMLFLVRQ